MLTDKIWESFDILIGKVPPNLIIYSKKLKTIKKNPDFFHSYGSFYLILALILGLPMPILAWYRLFHTQLEPADTALHILMLCLNTTSTILTLVSLQTLAGNNSSFFLMLNIISHIDAVTLGT